MSDFIRSALSQLRDRSPIRLRASSVGALFDCPERWIVINILGKVTQQRDRAAMGTAIHAGTALYDQDVLDGRVPSVLAATEATAQALSNPDEETVWDTKFDECLSIAVSLTAKYCREESHKFTFVAVESKCESLVLEDLALELTGSVDRIRTAGGKFGIADLKSGVQAVSREGFAKTQGHAPQIGTYEILGESSIGNPIELPGQIIGMQTGKTRESQRIAITDISDSRSVLIGNEQRVGLLAHAALMIHGVIPPYGNPRSMLCSDKYCPNFNNCFWRR